MAKGEQQKASQQAQDIKAKSEQQKTSGIFGGPQGAFGPQGLTGQYQGATSAAMKGIGDAQTTGGYDPNILGTLRKNTADMVTSGGVDPAAVDLYRNFTTTGGYSDADTSRYLRQATSGVQNTYNTLSANAARQRAATSGLGGDATAQMARKLSQVQAESTDKALADIHEQSAKNKLAGAGGLTDIGKLKQLAVAQQGQLEQGVANNIMQANQLMQLASTTAGQQILSLMGIDATSQEGALKGMTQLAQQPGMFDNIMKIAGVAGGAATGLSGGTGIKGIWG